MYDAGLMGVFMPFELYYLKSNNLRVFGGGGDVVAFPSQGGLGIKVLRSTIGGNLMVCGNQYMPQEVPNIDAYQFNAITKSFSFIGTRYGTEGVEVFDNIVKLYGINYHTIVGGINRPEINALGDSVLSRDAELFSYYNGKICINNGDNTWSDLITDLQPVRVQRVGLYYYYAVGAALKTQLGTVISFPGNIIDFYVSNETVVLTTDGIYWLSDLFSIDDQLSLTGVTANSMITIAGNFTGINLANNITVLLGHDVFYEMPEATNFIAIQSNN